MDKLLTVAQVAEATGYAKETIRRWCASGQLKAMRMPSGRLRIPAAAVEQLLSPVK